MRILQFMASEKWGGAEKVFVDLSNELSSKHSVIALILRNTEYKDRFSSQVQVIELKSHPTRNNPLLFLEIYRILKSCKVDVVHTHAAKAAILVRRVSALFSINHLATKHNSRRGKIFDYLPFVSMVSQDGFWSVSPKRKQISRVIHNGIRPKRRKGTLENGNFRIAAIGRLDKIKGFDILIDQLSEVNIPYHLTIAGTGKERQALQKKIDTLGLQDKVALAGFKRDVAGLMASSHLLVISSHSEGFPQVMVEALFYGNVLISTPVGGVPEVLPPLFLAEQQSLGIKIRDVYHNYAVHKQQFEELKSRKADQFTMAKIARQYELFYQEIIASTATGSI